jgi:hypothetical protein
MNGIGANEGRLERGALFPRGPVPPQATFSPAKFVKWTPCQIAVQIRAYERGLVNLPPDVCFNQLGLFGSFQASQYFTAGR